MPQVSIPNPTPLIDQSTMNESERAFVEMFERERGGQSSATDDQSLTSAEDEVDTTGTPGSPTTSTAAPESPTTVEGQSGGSESDPSQQSTTEPVALSGNTQQVDDLGQSTPVEGEPTEPGAAQPDPAFTFAGVDYSSTDLAQAVQLRGWYQNLQPTHIQAIDALLSGEYRLVPVNEVAPTPVSPPQPATSPASASPVTPADVDDAGEWLDPRAEAEINRLRTELSKVTESLTGITNTVTPLVQTQQSQQFDATLAAIDQAHAAFKDEYKLSDDDLKAVGDAFVQAQIFPSLMQQHNGNAELATRAGLEMVMWSTPSFRDRIVNQRVTALSTDDQAQQQAEKTRKLTSLASTGGSVPRRTATPQTKDERYAAMVEEIRSAANGNGSI